MRCYVRGPRFLDGQPHSWHIARRDGNCRLNASFATIFLLTKCIVRYDIPVDSGILIEESLRPGHFDIFATYDQLHPYLVMDFNEEVIKEG
jgi:hypothetical protein